VYKGKKKHGDDDDKVNGSLESRVQSQTILRPVQMLHTRTMKKQTNINTQILFFVDDDDEGSEVDYIHIIR
jgi:hypothetical protein